MKNTYFLFALLLYAWVCAAQTNNNLAIFPIVQMPIDGVSAGMGNLGVVLPGNLSGNHSRFNPALLYATDSTVSFQIHYKPEFSRVFAGFNQLGANLNFSVGQRHRFNAVWETYNLGLRTIRPTTCPVVNNFYTYMKSGKVGLQYSFKITDWLSAGVGMYGVQSQQFWACEDEPGRNRFLTGEWGLHFHKTLFSSAKRDIQVQAGISQRAIGPPIYFLPGDSILSVTGPVLHAGAMIELSRHRGAFEGISVGYQFTDYPQLPLSHSIGFQETFRFRSQTRLFLRQGIEWSETLGGTLSRSVYSGAGIQSGYFRFDAGSVINFLADVRFSTPLTMSMTYYFSK
ncbi:MAG: hypothetical protein R3C61_19980 [Bacteroidia bacterium]